MPTALPSGGRAQQFLRNNYSSGGSVCGTPGTVYIFPKRFFCRVPKRQTTQSLGKDLLWKCLAVVS